MLLNSDQYLYIPLIFSVGYSELCSLPEDRGDCLNSQSARSIRRWRFDESLGRCLQFSYSGCRGNRNNFVTEASCAMRCVEMRVVPEGRTSDDLGFLMMQL